jgi:hypothetical protein
LTFVLAAIGMVAVGIGAAVGLREPRGGRQQAPPTAG